MSDKGSDKSGDTGSNTWRAALEQFDTWLALPEAERAAWLAAISRSDPALHRRLEALIAADRDAEAQAFLGGTATPAARAEHEPTLAGRRLGPWQIDHLIGTGGMGQVWLARRTDGLYDGLAAIKLLRLAALDAGANARFAREGQLLGRLNHANIARLLDAGVTASGERYLVLEHVAGERIDLYCEHQRLSTMQRVALFIVVCNAVAHAHENLVVHRDLKPSNIFVTAAGDVKLLDFGVAKLLADDGGEATELTHAAGAAMTPHYASPEQLSGGTVTTATDVYALGLVLGELLTGARLGAGEAGDTGAATALRQAVPGDLAVVIGKATKPDAAERYRSVPDFADDLQRVLDQRPIAARPDSVAYRTSKFVRRHWVGVVATALIAFAVAAGVAGTLLKAREAEREAQRAVAVKRFLLDLFEQARSSMQAGGTQTREATVNDMLAAGADQVGKSFAAQPEIRDEVFQILVELYSDTGEPKQIVALARQRLAAAQAAFGAQDARSAPAEVMLGAVLINFGEIDEATRLLTHAQMLLDRAGDRHSLDRARLLRWQGILALATNAKPPWELHPLRQSAILLREHHPHDDELLTTLSELPRVACRYGDVAEALAGAEELHRLTSARRGPDNLYIDAANTLRGQFLVRSGRAADAIPVMQQALAGHSRHLGEKHPNVVLAQLELSEGWLAVGRADESQRAFEAAQQLVAQYHASDKRLARIVQNARDNLGTLRAGAPLTCKPR